MNRMMPWHVGDRVRWHIPDGQGDTRRNGDTGTITACHDDGTIEVDWDYGWPGIVNPHGAVYLHQDAP